MWIIDGKYYCVCPGAKDHLSCVTCSCFFDLFSVGLRFDRGQMMPVRTYFCWQIFKKRERKKGFDIFVVITNMAACCVDSFTTHHEASAVHPHQWETCLLWEHKDKNRTDKSTRFCSFWSGLLEFETPNLTSIIYHSFSSGSAVNILL